MNLEINLGSRRLNLKNMRNHLRALEILLFHLVMLRNITIQLRLLYSNSSKKYISNLNRHSLNSRSSRIIHYIQISQRNTIKLTTHRKKMPAKRTHSLRQCSILLSKAIRIHKNKKRISRISQIRTHYQLMILQ